MDQTSSQFADKNLVCEDCGKTFVFTAGEQEFYQKKGFESPRRCPECRASRKSERMANRKMTKVTCAKCGKEDEVPFVPRKDTPVLCKECFAASKQG